MNEAIQHSLCAPSTGGRKVACVLVGVLLFGPLASCGERPTGIEEHDAVDAGDVTIEGDGVGDASDALDAWPDLETASDSDRDVRDVEPFPPGPFDLSRIPENPDCIDGVWNPVPGWGPEAGFEIDLGSSAYTRVTVPAEGGVVCRDGIRLWFPPPPSGEPIRFDLSVTRRVPFGSAHTLGYSIGWLGYPGAFWPADHSIAVDLGEIPGGRPVDETFGVYASRQASPDLLASEPVPIFTTERTEFGWRLQMEWFGLLDIGRDRPDPLCGNGVLDPTEYCDPGIDGDTRLCDPSLCWPRSNSDCDANGCYDGADLADQCERPSTQCWEKLPWVSVYGCGGRPVNEGFPCNLDEPFLYAANNAFSRDDINVGVCRVGECVPAQDVQCEGCDPEVVRWSERIAPIRYVDGECVASLSESEAEGGIFEEGRCDPRVPGCDNCPGCLPQDEGSGTDVGFPNGARYLRFDYQHVAWYRGEVEREASERFELEVFCTDEAGSDLPITRVPLPVEAFGEVASFLYEVPPRCFLVQVEFAGFANPSDADRLSRGIEVANIEFFTYETDRCDIAFEVGDEVVTCPRFPTAIECDEMCVDPLSDNNNCGGCGITCEGSDMCVEGECVCHPALVAVNPDACDNGCPPGFGGNQCERECLGQIGEGIYCNGNGSCSEGPAGWGTCICDPGFHGAGCIYSCSDGVRNGEEWNVDCGGGAAACGSYCGRGDDLIRDRP